MHRTFTRTKARTFATVVVALVAMASVGGCARAPELARVKNDLNRQFPDAHFEKEFAFTAGPLTLALARAVTGMIPDASVASNYLRGVRKAQVAIYRLDSAPPADAITMPEPLVRMIEHDGWEVAVRVHDGEELVWVLYRVDGGAIRDVFIAVMDPDQLVLVKARGKIDRLVAQALVDAHETRDIPFMRRHGQDS